MVQFKAFSVKVCFVAIGILVRASKDVAIKGNLPELNTIVNFLQNVIGPYIKTLRATDDNVFRSLPETKIQKLIHKKIEELRPWLQDNDDSTENKQVMLDGKDETTIIEFVPNIDDLKKLKEQIKKTHKKQKLKTVRDSDFLQEKLKKYEKMRQKIKKALDDELVSDKTKSMVTKTLNKMLTQLIENQCVKTENTRTKDVENTSNTSISSMWQDEWNNLKNILSPFSNSDLNVATFRAKKLYMFFDQFHDFITNVAKDTEFLSSRYKIVCRLVERDKPSNKNFEDKYGMGRSNSICDKFRVCSEELKTFMGNFYNSVNHTAISTLSNYAEMFVRDVNYANDREKSNFVSIIKDICNASEKQVEKIFSKITSRFKLDFKKDRKANVKALKSYVEEIVETVKEKLKIGLEPRLSSLNTKVKISVIKDLSVNFDLDLGSTRREFKGKICKEFLTCNSKTYGRRTVVSDSHENSVYVKLQLALDDEMREKFVRSKFLDSFVRKKQGKNAITHVPERRSYNVTRTSPLEISTPNTSTFLSGIIVERFNSTKKTNETINAIL